jgi:hypothetical protein
LSEQEPEGQQEKEEGEAIEKADEGIHRHEERGVKPATFESRVLTVEFQGNQVNQHEVAYFKRQKGKAQKSAEPELLMPPRRDSQAQAIKGREQPGKEGRILQPKINERIETIVRQASDTKEGMVLRPIYYKAPRLKKEQAHEAKVNDQDDQEQEIVMSLVEGFHSLDHESPLGI